MPVMSKEQCRLVSVKHRNERLERKIKELEEENQKLKSEKFASPDVSEIDSLRSRLRLAAQRNLALKKEIRELREEVEFLRGWSENLSNVNADCIRNNCKYIKEYRELKEEVERLRAFNRGVSRSCNAQKCANNVLKEENDKFRKQLGETLGRSIKRAKQLEIIKMAINGDIELDTSKGP